MQSKVAENMLQFLRANVESGVEGLDDARAFVRDCDGLARADRAFLELALSDESMMRRTHATLSQIGASGQPAPAAGSESDTDRMALRGQGVGNPLDADEGGERRRDARRILIVDDEHMMTAVLARYLETKGFECLTTHNGVDACTKGPHFDPAAAIVDIRLGSESGVDVARQLRDRLPGLPIIGVSGDGTHSCEEYRATRHFREVLPKPFDFPTLATTLQGLIGDEETTAAGMSCKEVPL
jgi:CheY-like chemotaxis protein